jgi:hypothetical protein
MKTIIQNVEMDFNTGLRIAKTKFGDHCPFPETEAQSIWSEVQPLTFAEIAKIENVEHRRVAFLYYDMEKFIAESGAELADSVTYYKFTTWVNEQGGLESRDYEDTYELFKVSKEILFPEDKYAEDAYFISCKDTSTDRIYRIWISPNSIMSMRPYNDRVRPITAREAIAWTITTPVPKGNIERILRQGDCILVKKIDPKLPDNSHDRHLSPEEYESLITAES